MTTLEKMRNLWHGISKPPLRKEMVFFIFMLRLVTFSVILSASKEKCSQSLSMSHKHLLWLSKASVFALLFNYRTHGGHLLFASVASVNNIYSSDHHKGSLLCVSLSVVCFIILLSRTPPAAGGSSAAAWQVPEIARHHKGSSSPHCHCEMDTS